MTKSHNYIRSLTAILAAVILLAAPVISNAAADTGIPSFIHAGKKYKFSFGGIDIPVTILELVNDGWVKAKFQGTVQWVNLRHVLTIAPAE
jgi:hypothetical protein